MAKQHKNKGGGNKRNGDGRLPLGASALVGGVFGNMLGQLLADGLEKYAEKARVKSGAASRDDTAARLLRVLAEHGPKSVPELLAASGAGLTAVLHALQTVR